MTQVYKIQVSMNQAHLVDSGLTFKQGDFGFQIEIEVLDFDVTGVTPQIIFRKSSGAVESTSITVSNNKFTYTMQGTELDTPGPGICDLKLKNSTTQRISTASFKFFVISDTMDGLNEQASSYSDTIAQIVGGFDDEISALNAEDEAIISKVLTTADETFTISNGCWVDSDGVVTATPSSNYKRTVIDCSYGEIYLVKVAVATSIPYFAFISDNSDNVLESLIPRTGEQETVEVQIFISDQSWKKLYVTSQVSQTIEIKKYVDKYLPASDAATKEELEALEDQVGDVKYKETESEHVKQANGLEGTVGNAVSERTTSSYTHTVVDASPDTLYKVRTYTGTSANYPYYVFITDENDIILSLECPSGTSAGLQTVTFTTPSQTAKIYVCQYGASTDNMYIAELEKVSVQAQIDELTELVEQDNAKELVAEAMPTIIGHTSSVNGASIVFITDTHSNGEFYIRSTEEMITGLDSKLSVSAFRAVAESGIAVLGVHGGDIISAYNISKSDYIETLTKHLMDYDGYRMPVFFAKGNHECNHEDGLYEEGDEITKSAYFSLVQNRDLDKKVVNPADPCGGYFYYDDEKHKIRFIVLNAFYDPEESGIEYVFGNTQHTWLSEVALNLESKTDASKWGIVGFVHPSASSTATMQLFGSYSGSATVIGVIHGHSHEDMYSDSRGYNNIGVDRAYASANETGANRCCVSVFTFVPTVEGDNENGIIYETRIGRGSDRAFNWGSTIGPVT